MSPTYEYICKLCDVDYEETRAINEAQIVLDCPECGETLYRKFGKLAVSFRGDGFYTTDKNKKGE